MIFVDNVCPRTVSQGLTLNVFGGFFDNGCKVKIGSHEAPVDTLEESHIVVVVPNITGTFSCTVEDSNGNSVAAGSVSVTATANVPVRELVTNKPLEDFEVQIIGLFPRGFLFNFESGSVVRRLVKGIATSVRYAWNFVRSLSTAMDPLHTENFGEWEAGFGLPEIGIPSNSSDDRRHEIYRVGFSRGGCSINFYKKILALMKIDADIFEYVYNPEAFEGINFGDNDPRFYIMIRFRLPTLTYRYFTAGESVAGDYLFDFSSYKEENVFNKLKQGHVKIIFAYMVEQNVYVISSAGRRIIAGNGKKVIARIYPE